MRLFQNALGIFHIQILQETLRTYPRPLLKHPLEMSRTHIHMSGYRLQPGLFLPVLLDKADGGSNAFVIQFLLLFHLAKGIMAKPH